MDRFITTKNGPVVSAPRAVPVVAGSVEVYSNTSDYQSDEESFAMEISTSVSIPFTESCTLLCRAQSEVTSFFSDQAIDLFFRPFTEYFPNNNSVPRVLGEINAFYDIYDSLNGVLSIDASETESPYNLTATVSSWNKIGGPDHGFYYARIKLVVVKGEYTGVTTMNDYP